jgi:hypothetical protein
MFSGPSRSDVIRQLSAILADLSSTSKLCINHSGVVMGRFLRRSMLALTFIIIPIADAQAFWWLLRGAAGRGAVGTAARGAAGTGAAAESAGAFAYSRPLASGARFCVRPAGAAACDYHSANSALEAARGAVDPSYRLRPTRSPNLFEVLDAVGNVISIIEVLGKNTDSSISNLPQYVPPSEGREVYIHNQSNMQLALSVQGNTCTWSEIFVQPASSTSVNCPDAAVYFVNINTTDSNSGQVFSIRQEIFPSRHYILGLTQSYPSAWQLYDFNPN